MEDSVKRLERIGAGFKSATPEVRAIIQRRVNVHMATVQIERALDGLLQLPWPVTTDRDVAAILQCLFQVDRVANDLDDIYETLAATRSGRSYQVAPGFVGTSAHMVLWDVWAVHLLKLLGATAVGAGPKGTTRKRVRLAIERWNALTDGERSSSLSVLREVSSTFVLTTAVVKQWKAELWAESLEAERLLKSAQSNLTLTAETTCPPRKSTRKPATRVGGQAPQTPERKRREKRMNGYDKLLLQLLLQGLATGDRRILTRSFKELGAQLSSPTKAVSNSDLRPGRTPVFRAACAWLTENKGKTQLPAKILNMIPERDRGEFEDRTAELDRHVEGIG